MVTVGSADAGRVSDAAAEAEVADAEGVVVVLGEVTTDDGAVTDALTDVVEAAFGAFVGEASGVELDPQAVSATAGRENIRAGSSDRVFTRPIVQGRRNSQGRITKICWGDAGPTGLRRVITSAVELSPLSTGPQSDSPASPPRREQTAYSGWP
jgi:hypothetical protein